MSSHCLPALGAQCWGAWQGAEEPQGLRDPSPGRASLPPSGMARHWPSLEIFGFHSFMEKDSGKRKGEEKLKGETEPRGAAAPPLQRHLAPALCRAGQAERSTVHGLCDF